MPVEQPPKTQSPDGETGTGEGPTGSGGGTPSPSTIYYGYCTSPSHKGEWIGPDRDTEASAAFDCRDHNAQCADQAGHVVSRAV